MGCLLIRPDNRFPLNPFFLKISSIQKAFGMSNPAVSSYKGFDFFNYYGLFWLRTSSGFK